MPNYKPGDLVRVSAVADLPMTDDMVKDYGGKILRVDRVGVSGDPMITLKGACTDRGSFYHFYGCNLTPVDLSSKLCVGDKVRITKNEFAGNINQEMLRLGGEVHMIIAVSGSSHIGGYPYKIDGIEGKWAWGNNHFTEIIPHDEDGSETALKVEVPVKKEPDKPELDVRYECKKGTIKSGDIVNVAPGRGYTHYEKMAEAFALRNWAKGCNLPKSGLVFVKCATHLTNPLVTVCVVKDKDGKEYMVSTGGIYLDLKDGAVAPPKSEVDSIPAGGPGNACSTTPYLAVSMLL